MAARHFIFPYAVTLNARIIECVGQNHFCAWKVYRNILNKVGKLEAIWLYRIKTVLWVHGQNDSHYWKQAHLTVQLLALSRTRICCFQPGQILTKYNINIVGLSIKDEDFNKRGIYSKVEAGGAFLVACSFSYSQLLWALLSGQLESPSKLSYAYRRKHFLWPKLYLN